MKDYKKMASSIIVKEIYPMIAKSLEKNTPALKRAIGKFVSDRHEALYDTGLTYRVYYKKDESDAIFNALKIKENDVLAKLKKCFFWDIGYNPKAAKQTIIVTMFCAVRYYLIKKDKKMSELACVYLAFTGPMYASVHGNSFKPYAPKKECMDYVVNHKLTYRFLLKKEGTLFGAVLEICRSWLEAYKELITDKAMDDHDYGQLIQQLRDREASMVKAVARPYYDAYNSGEYFNYESENLDDSDFRMVENDSLRIANDVDNVMTYITQNSIDYQICRSCADQNVNATEVKMILQAILSEKAYLEDLRFVLSTIISDFVVNNPGKKVTSIDFLSYSMTMKPNTKDKNILRMKDTIIKWLTEKSPNYVRRRSRPDTANSYYKTVLYYLVLVIHKVVK